MRKLGTLAAVIASAALAASPAAAAVTTEVATKDNVTATFTYTASTGDTIGYTGLNLQIAQAGQVLYGAAITGCDLCWPGAPKGESIHVVDLAPAAPDEVVLDLYTGGAHCCFVEQVFTYSAASMGYVQSQYYAGDAQPVLKDLDHNHKDEFVSADDSFADQFSSFAGSGLPLMILDFAGGKFKDITRSYPVLIRKDAAFWLRTYRRFETPLDTGDGVIAAWAADEDNLHQEALVTKTLKSERARRHISGTFIGQLQRFLRHQGYTR